MGFPLLQPGFHARKITAVVSVSRNGVPRVFLAPSFSWPEPLPACRCRFPPEIVRRKLIPRPVSPRQPRHIYGADFFAAGEFFVLRLQGWRGFRGFHLPHSFVRFPVGDTGPARAPLWNPAQSYAPVGRFLFAVPWHRRDSSAGHL